MYNHVIKETFNIIVEKKGALLRVLLVPFLLLFVSEYYLLFEITSKYMQHTSDSQIKEYIVSILMIGIVRFFLISMMSFCIYRILLLGENSVSNFCVFNIGKTELHFIFYFIKIMIIFLIFAAIVGVATAMFLKNLDKMTYQVFFGIVIGLLFSRISLVFPAAAVEKSINFAESYSLTKNYKMFIFIILTVPTFLQGLIMDYAYEPVVPNSLISSSLFTAFTGTIYTVIVVGLLSMSYKYILEKSDS